jgi:hypothetical protein
MTIKIKPIVKGSAGMDKKFDVPHPLPNSPFIMAMIGMKASGKSTVITNLVKNYYFKNFDYIIVLSPTCGLSDEWDWLEDKKNPDKVSKFSDMTEYADIVKEIANSQEELLRNTDREDVGDVLIILDDIIGSNIIRFQGLMDAISIKHRHLKISLMFALQRMSALSRTIRLQADMMLLWNCVNLSELETFLEQYCLKKYRKSIMEKVDDIYSEKYAFISINNRLDRSERIREGFDNVIEFKTEKRKTEKLKIKDEEKK